MSDDSRKPSAVTLIRAQGEQIRRMSAQEYLKDKIDVYKRQVVILSHSETISDDNGYLFTRIKTNGRKLDKIVLESKLTTVPVSYKHLDVYKRQLFHDSCRMFLNSLFLFQAPQPLLFFCQLNL